MAAWTFWTKEPKSPQPGPLRTSQNPLTQLLLARNYYVCSPPLPPTVEGPWGIRQGPEWEKEKELKQTRWPVADQMEPEQARLDQGEPGRSTPG